MEEKREKTVSVVRAEAPEQFAQAGALASALWPHNTAQAMTDDLARRDRAENAVLLAMEGGEAIGFAHAALRHDYVQGTDSSPVGYLEGIYVRDAHRLRGVARALVDAAAAWAKAQGCTEFASDCELENVYSARMHKALGFEEAGRIVCFVRPID